MKLKPKDIKFCPGCGNKLKLTPPKFVIKEEIITQQNDNKIITLTNVKKEKKNKVKSLFQ